MKIQTQVYLDIQGRALVHLWDGSKTYVYQVDVEQAMNLYPERTTTEACAKVAKVRFKSLNAFCGYE
jgi:hypothetical protein